MKEGNGDVVTETVESVGSEDALEELPERTRRRRGRPYKIQEVIRRRQIILVQVVKEERGNKGAALTTYLSLAGRYTGRCPTRRAAAASRARSPNPPTVSACGEIAGELEVPLGMGLIIRTAGAGAHQNRRSNATTTICCGCGRTSATSRYKSTAPCPRL